jgi:hypothetical protein
LKVSNVILYKPFIPLESKTSTCQKQRDKEVTEKEKLKVGFYYPVSFGYHHPLKTAWVKGKLPWLQYGFYGERLTKKNVSIEHLQPVADFKKVYSPEKAKRLATTWENVVLASNCINNLRGCEPLSSVIDYEAMGKYLQQFEGKYIEGFGTGEQYIKGILDTVNRLIQQEIP